MENAADRCLRYLYNTATLGIAFDGSQGATMVAHSDSDWALRHSTTGYLLHHGSLVGPPIGYGSKRQHCIALSSCEAEIMAASQAATEVTYFRGIMRDLGLDQPNPTILPRYTLYVDTSTILYTGAEELARELKSCARSRHIFRRYLKVRELQAEGEVQVRHVASADNTSDIFTKLPSQLIKLNS
eukprot:scaffold396_cov127-Isochrysis_galbana.AAC.6